MHTSCLCLSLNLRVILDSWSSVRVSLCPDALRPGRQTCVTLTVRTRPEILCSPALAPGMPGPHPGLCRQVAKRWLSQNIPSSTEVAPGQPIRLHCLHRS